MKTLPWLCTVTLSESKSEGDTDQDHNETDQDPDTVCTVLADKFTQECLYRSRGGQDFSNFSYSMSRMRKWKIL